MISKAQQRRYEEIYRPAYDALMKFYPLTLDDLDGELWKPIPDYEDYQNSNFGRVKSFWFGKVKILKPALHGNGYLFVSLSKNDTQKNFTIHRLVAKLFIPNPDNKPQVNHIDTHKLNNYVGNLEWTTGSENHIHAVVTGLHKSGSDCFYAKFTNADIKFIRANPDNLTVKALGEKFNVNPQIICKIQLGQIYKNAGGTVRKPLKKYSPPVPENIKQKIRAEYVKRSCEFGAPALAKKYGLGETTILRIVKSAE